jgi:hypothetical protein
MNCKVVVSRLLSEDSVAYSDVAYSDLARLIIDDGGEGIILRKVHSLYEQGRSISLFKLKVSLSFPLPPPSFSPSLLFLVVYSLM